jgi:hypothetical protein
VADQNHRAVLQRDDSPGRRRTASP